MWIQHVVFKIKSLTGSLYNLGVRETYFIEHCHHFNTESIRAHGRNKGLSDFSRQCRNVCFFFSEAMTVSMDKTSEAPKARTV